MIATMGFWRNPIHERLDELEIDQAWQRRARRKDAHPDAYELPSHGFWWKLFDELANLFVSMLSVGLIIASFVAGVILSFAGTRPLLVALAGYVPILGIPALLFWRWIDLGRASQPKLFVWSVIVLVGVASLAWLIALIYIYAPDVDWGDGPAQPGLY
jgi:hypothetical protein